MATICRKHKLLFIMVPATGCSSIGRTLREKFGGEFIPKVPLYQNSEILIGCKHNSIRELIKYGYLSRVELSIYLKFATVRNPFDSLVTEYQRFTGEWAKEFLAKQESRLDQDISEYEKKCVKIAIKNIKRQIREVKDKSFEEWLKDYFLKNSYYQADLTNKIKNKIKSFTISNYYPNISPLLAGVDEIIRYEFLEEDFNMILKKSGIINSSEWISLRKQNTTKGKDDYRSYYTSTTIKLVEKYLEKELKVFGYNF